MGQRELLYEPSMKRSVVRAATVCRLDVGGVVKEASHPRDALSSRYLVGHGVKRMLSRTEEALCLPYPQQRQLVLDLCLDKLQSVRTHAEPSLRRSVLLANTLRQIQEEMQRENGDSPSLTPPCVLQDEGSVPEDVANPLFGSFEITNSTSYMTDLALDDIFEDIDTSMYDTADTCALVFSSTWGLGSQSSILDDGLKVLSSCTPASALQLCFTDLSDLDHIMEILVQP
ncbi:cell division cycle-associated protein 4-like [Paramormyrops kingsleyae]|uniref:Si:dkey-177p2.6 n=1 Tax=Paramormyrops kingsleyae TaxID=1676925 RepID=A0A3B3SQQ9_9TELE|nr:SERTA domain-containing protein 2-like [Paramormyrops kingsleyae]